MAHRYVTDIDIPNLDAMSVDELEEYAADAGVQAESASSPKSSWLHMAAKYARTKARAMRARLGGDIKMATRYEAACDDIYAQIPKRMKW